MGYIILMLIGTLGIVATIAYFVIYKSRLSERATCFLCGEELDLKYNEGAYAWDAVGIIEKEHKCKKCGGE
ncbi:hypothetical protein [Sutcliffiella horikoshii]|uniref:hypothetical protein n=1 Tax=Sutcliffiella horikoshii TaxID=79883 RepID=UPI001F1595B4|nr:hypothetical protein [Sutcliffiella horikoshii]MCG1022889.1 hypothetical protein [Sutcliffiella horikoshii]